MSPRKSILRELSAAGPDSFRKPGELEGFTTQAPKYRAAVNTLLRDQLISGSKDTEGNLVIGLNARRIPEIERELRPWFRAPVAWALVAGAAAVVFAALFI